MRDFPFSNANLLVLPIRIDCKPKTCEVDTYSLHNTFAAVRGGIKIIQNLDSERTIGAGVESCSPVSDGVHLVLLC